MSRLTRRGDAGITSEDQMTSRFHEKKVQSGKQGKGEILRMVDRAGKPLKKNNKKAKKTPPHQEKHRWGTNIKEGATERGSGAEIIERWQNGE